MINEDRLEIEGVLTFYNVKNQTHSKILAFNLQHPSEWITLKG